MTNEDQLREDLGNIAVSLAPGAETTARLDPVCIFHGKRWSEHHCLYCCLCFKTLTLEECHVRSDGKREDVCEECAEHEALAAAVSEGGTTT